MARSTGRTYSRWPLSRNNEDRFLDLQPSAQHLYWLLYHSTDITHAGIVDWRPGRLTARARNMTVDYVLDAAAELEADGWVLFDGLTEEALVVDHLYDDEFLRNPNNAIGLIRAHAAIASRTLRAAVITELHRCHAQQPEFSAWSSPISAAKLAALLEHPGLNPADYRPAYGDRTHDRAVTAAIPSPMPSVSVSPNPSDTPSALVVRNLSAIPSPTPSPTPSHTPSGTPSGTPISGVTGSDPEYHPDPYPGHQPGHHGSHPEYHPEYHSTSTKNHEPRTSGGYLPTVGKSRARDAREAPPPTPPTPLTVAEVGRACLPDSADEPSAEARPPSRPPKYHPGHPDGYDADCADCDAVADAYAAWLTERAAEDPDDPEPARDCSRHPDAPYRSCRICAALRQQHDQWNARHQTRLAAAAEWKAHTIAACARRRYRQRLPALCDEYGWRIPPPEIANLDYGVVRCDHTTADLPPSWQAQIDALHPERHTA